MHKKVLVTTDGSSLSKKAVNHAIGLCAATGAELIALRVTALRTDLLRRFTASDGRGSLQDRKKMG